MIHILLMCTYVDEVFNQQTPGSIGQYRAKKKAISDHNINTVKPLNLRVLVDGLGKPYVHLLHAQGTTQSEIGMNL